MIINGNALEVMRELKPRTFGGLITDPPYSSGGMFRGDRAADTKTKYTDDDANGAASLASFTGDNKDGRSYTSWSAEWLTLAHRLLKDGSPVLVFCDWRQIPTITDALQWAGFIWRGIVVWDKKNARPQKGRFRAQAEYVVWGSKGNMPIDRNAPVLPGVISCAVPLFSKRVHQTQKPVELLRQLIKIVEPGEAVLDPFAGSGSLNEAARLEGYECTGIELCPYYAGVAEGREIRA